MPRNKRKGEIRIFEGRKGGGSRRAGSVRSFRRTGKFKASFVPEKDWVVNLDSRDLQAIVGTAIYGHLKRSIAADQDPETGAAHPKTLSTRKGRGGRNTTRDRDVDTHAMAAALRRTICDYKWVSKTWGGKWGRIQLPRTRMTFYFEGGPEGRQDGKNPFWWNSLNQADSTRRGKNRIIWLGVGGNTARQIRPALAKWAALAMEGQRFDRDSKVKARKGI